MAEPALNLASGSENDSADINKTLSARLSKELVIALCGPLGCGIKHTHRILKERLKTTGYNIVDIRVSKLLENAAKQLNLETEPPTPSSTPAERIEKLQKIGSKLRKIKEESIAAQLVIREIAVWREKHPDHKDPAKLAISQPTVFIVDQLKHPSEVTLLKRAYNSIFYQLGIVSSESEKIQRLIDNGIDKNRATSLIELDRKENQKSGQQLEKTLLLSDYFLSNISGNLPKLSNNIDRFLKLAHGVNGITPTKAEVGMYSAYSSSLRSACLSRQVGAAIADKEGNIIATGRNDVPKSSGGLYESEDADNDHRCINHGAKCYSTTNISKLTNQISKILIDLGFDEDKTPQAIQMITEETAIGSLIEFSRAIHAEMDAITTLARSTQANTRGATIYTTTYPCHNCARHIVAAGIAKVVYIEPYEKSLAIQLHGDALARDHSGTDKVSITAFEGVAPRRYQTFFLARGKRKDNNGNAVAQPINPSTHVDSVLLAKYTETEEQVTKHVTELLSNIPVTEV